MTARNQLADVIEDAIDSVHDMGVTHHDDAERIADAVLWMISEAVLSEREACAMICVQSGHRRDQQAATAIGLQRVRWIAGRIEATLLAAAIRARSPALPVAPTAHLGSAG